MINLTEDQRDFLGRHGIPLSNVFDASKYAKSAGWQARMKELNVAFAFGTSPCKKAGHTLRTRKGHCIQCSPSNISYYNRFREAGYVYIAHSKSADRVKVGMTTDLVERGKQLNIYKYGGASDWSIVVSVRADRAGELECRTQNALRSKSVNGSYIKAGDVIACHELFDCEVEFAKQVLMKNLPVGADINLSGWKPKVESEGR